MDNITHTLVGLMVGESAYEIRKFNDRPDNRDLRRYFLVTSALANNIPDIDIFYSGFMGDLGYLLHHRGHTHTLLGGIPVAVLVGGLCFLFARYKKHVFGKEDWAWIGTLSLLGVVLHLLLDSLNSYGVHPFWPFYNGWLYGDSLFIVEPWLWMILSVSLLRLNANRLMQMSLGVVGVVALLLCLFTGFVPYQISIAIVLVSAALFFGLKYLNDYRKTFVALGLISILFVIFGGTSRYIKRTFSKYYKAQYEATELTDLVLSPFPANPLCWAVVSVELADDKTSFFMRTGVLAPFPRVFSLSSCEKLGFIEAEGAGKTDEKMPEIHWLGQTKTDLRVLRNIVDTSCLAKEFLQFSRTPYLVKENNLMKITDLRFVRKNRSSFAQAVLVDNPHCLKIPVPWIPPRVKELESKPE